MKKRILILPFILIVLVIGGVYYSTNLQKKENLNDEDWKGALEKIVTTKDEETEDVEWPGPFKELDTTEFDSEYKTFENIGNGSRFYVYNSKGDVYFSTSYIKDESKLVQLIGADSKFFSKVDTACSVEKSSSLFVKDNDQVFLGYIEISNDPTNFQILERIYSQDGMPSSETIAKDSNNFYLGCGNKLVTEDDLDVSTSNLTYIGDGVFSDDVENYIFRERRLESNLSTRKITFDTYVVKSLDLPNGQEISYSLPIKYRDRISTEIITKKVDNLPSNFSENYDGALEYIEMSKYMSPVPDYVNGGWHTFVTSTNYKWNVYEMPVSNNLHVEFGYSYKNEEDTIPLRDWIDVIYSINIK